ncbi:MAG: leucine-rich repeat protein, partial [Clostridiales bacterium]|nr:leucine-rich repeat protein [Clostridiales bacterium]
MNKKKTWGTNLLAIIVTISIVFSIGGNVWADPVEPGNQEPAASSEQEKPEEPSDPADSGDPTDPAEPGEPTDPADSGDPTDPAEPPEAPPSNRKGGADQAAPQSNEPQETYDISSLPDAEFSLVPKNVKISHSGYTDIKCKFDKLAFGLLDVNGDTLVAADLKLSFPKTGTITDKNGHSIPFTVTNGTHDLPSTYALEFKYSWNEEGVYEPFTIAVNIDLDDYKTLANGPCTGKIDYTSTWVNAFNPNASNNNYPNISGPSGSINFNMHFYGPEYESGTFESGTQWELNNGNLHIGGTGSMPDFTDSTGSFQAPWIERKNEITSVTIDDDVTNIGDYAFSGCQNLTQVNIGRRSKLTYIGERAFQSCGFSSITLPDDLPLTTIREAAFFNCQKLEKIDLTGCYKLTTISKWAFGYCMKMGTVELPYNLTDIGEAAFEYCYDLATIRIPSGVTRIEKNTFYDCTDLTSVSTTNNVTSIGVGAFEGCRNLKNFVFPTQITEISDSTF